MKFALYAVIFALCIAYSVSQGGPEIPASGLSTPQQVSTGGPTVTVTTPKAHKQKRPGHKRPRPHH